MGVKCDKCGGIPLGPEACCPEAEAKPEPKVEEPKAEEKVEEKPKAKKAKKAKK